MLKICPRYAKEICKNKLGQNVHYFYESWGKMSWGKMSLGQNVSGAKCPWGKMSRGGSWANIPKQPYLWIGDAALMRRNRSFKYSQKDPSGWDYPQTVILHRSWEKVVSKSWIEQSANLNRLCLPLDMNNMTFKKRNFEGSSTCFKGKTILHS